jgi:MoxR-like ATPase
LDRFLFKVDVTFPSTNELIEIMDRTTGVTAPYAQVAADGQRIVAMGELARQVPIASHVSQYIAELVVATHPTEVLPDDSLVRQYVRYGASPRGAQALVLGAKVNALLDGRYNVAFEDVQSVAYAALRHRILLNFEGQAEGVLPDTVIADLLERVPIPAGA